MQTTNASDTLTIRRSNERGHADHGWLNSHHSFSFAGYHDPAHMGFRSLRVINQDRVSPGGGFPTHPHQDMEIFSYVLEGELQHQDSMGNRSTLKPGEIQLMSAGRGVTHSEFNPSDSLGLHFLQIWIQPSERGIEPRYTEWDPAGHENESKTLVISPDGRQGSATITQDADVWRIKTQQAETLTHQLAEGRGAWLQVIHGSVTLANGVKLEAGDAASTEVAQELKLQTGDEGLEALLFDLN